MSVSDIQIILDRLATIDDRQQDIHRLVSEHTSDLRHGSKAIDDLRTQVTAKVDRGECQSSHRKLEQAAERLASERASWARTLIPPFLAALLTLGVTLLIRVA